jgi:inosose dehydratase
MENRLVERIVSCFSNSYGASGVWAAAERICQAGISHMELALRGHNLGGLVIPESAVLTEKADDATVESFRNHLGRCGVQISGCNVGGADIRTREGLELTERRIRFAARCFGVPVCVTGAGQPADVAERAVVVENLRRLGATAADVGVTLALETHKGPTQNATAMLALMGEVSHPNVRLNFDTGNIAYYNRGLDPCLELDRVKHLVRNVHVKDNRGLFEDWYFPALGEAGAVDFARVREILDRVGFTGPYTIEIEGIGGEPEPGFEARHERVARSVEHLRACGFFD